MKLLKGILLYLMSAFYLFMGSMHFIEPMQYDAMIPGWLPIHTTLIYASGCIEIVLSVLLLFRKTRAIAAKIIMLMLLVFLIFIHIPQSIEYYRIEHSDYLFSIVRIVIQFLLIGWAWLYTKK